MTHHMTHHLGDCSTHEYAVNMSGGFHFSLFNYIVSDIFNFIIIIYIYNIFVYVNYLILIIYNYNYNYKL